MQGDVIAITNADGEVVARYQYDAWGVCTIASDTSGRNIATVNPYRYRGYYYDAEIGMYYLQSRYYNPVVGRFINGDAAVFALAEMTSMGANLFTYCGNFSMGIEDSSGYWYRLTRYNYNTIVGILSTAIPLHVWKLANYRNNRRYPIYDYIHGQDTYPTNKMRYGWSNMGHVGCELIAIYNVAKKLGKHRQLYDVILEFEYNLGQLAFGAFGTDPHYIVYYLAAHKFKYKKACTLKTLEWYNKRGACYILSFWINKRNIFEGLHTVAVYYNRSGEEYEVYNENNKVTSTKCFKSFSEIIGKGRFVCGYRVE